MADNPFLASLVAAWGGDENAIPDIETEPFPDETLSPGMSDFIRNARRYLAAMADDHDFVDSIQVTANRLRDYLVLHRELLGTLTLTFPQQALAHLSTQALITFSEGLSDMLSCFSRGELPNVESGIERCKQAIIVLEAWWIELSRVVRQQADRVCAHCGEVNAPELGTCGGCGAALPPLDDTFHPRQEYLWLPDFWIDLYKATRAMVAGKLPAAEWAGQVEDLRVQILDVQAQLHELTGWQDVGDELRTEYESVYRGLAELRGALEQMQRFPGAGKLPELEQGWFRLVCALRSLAEPCAALRQELLTVLEQLEAESPSEVE
jgi:hypothetical protein